MLNRPDSEALRAIGEDLDRRGIKTFAIRWEGDVFLVDAGYQSPPAVTPFTLHYTPEDIEDLHRKAHEQRNYLSATRSFIYLTEILSAIEIYVTDKGSRLLSVSNTASTEAMPVIDIEYETVGRERTFERLTDSEIYAICVRGHKRRGRTLNLHDLRFTRFSSLQNRPTLSRR